MGKIPHVRVQIAPLRHQQVDQVQAFGLTSSTAVEGDRK
jgi:hypothetical protein